MTRKEAINNNEKHYNGKPCKHGNTLRYTASGTAACKECMREHKVKYKDVYKRYCEKNKEKITIEHRAYYLENKERLDKYHAEYRKANPDKFKAYYKANYLKAKNKDA